MARNTTLQNLVQKVRYEARQSAKTSVNVDQENAVKEIIRSTQEWLYYEFEWPQFRTYQDVELEAGKRIYDFPLKTDPDRIIAVFYKYNGDWYELHQGIQPEHYNAHDSEADERQERVHYWDWYNSGSAINPQFEVWPKPITNATPNHSNIVRFESPIKLPQLVEESDRALLDDRLIALYAAAELMEYMKIPGADTKRVKADQFFAAVRSRISNPRDPVILGEVQNRRLRSTPVRAPRTYNPNSTV